MGWFGDLLSFAAPIATSFIPGVGPLLAPLVGGVAQGLNRGSGGSAGGFDMSALAPYLSGQATAQRIPGQTTPGSYTPEAGGYGTYNYIPTGAEQLDPQLISQILASITGNNAAAGTATGANNTALSSILAANQDAFTRGQSGNSGIYNQSVSNPDYGRLIDNARGAGAMSGQNATTQQNWGAGLGGAGGSVNDMFQNLMSRAASNPFTSSMVSGAQDAGQRFQNAGTWLSDFTAGGIQNLQNPYYGQQMQGAQTAGNLLGASGADTFNKGATFSGSAAAGLPAVSSILNTAFDPQTAQYNKAATQNQDQIASYLARSGLTSSGAGAGIASDATTNFNLGWQNQQLGRQSAGIDAYTKGMTGIGSNLGTGSNLQATGAGNLAGGAALPANTLNQQTGSRFDLSSKGSSALGAAEGLNLAGTQIPYQAYDTSTNDYSKYLSSYANALPSIGGALTSGSNLLNQGVQSSYNAGAIPYNATQTANVNNQNSLTNYLSNASSLNGLSGQSNVNSYITNAYNSGALQNQPTQQLMDYLRLVMGGSANAANAATGAQAGTNTSNANAAAGMQPLISGGLNTLQSLISRMFSGGAGSSVTPYSGMVFGGASPGSTITPYSTQIFA